jgi:hypothetical protein
MRSALKGGSVGATGVPFAGEIDANMAKQRYGIFIFSSG